MLVRVTTVTIVEDLPIDYLANNFDPGISVIAAAAEETDAVMSDVGLIIDAIDEQPFTVSVHFMEIGE